MVENKIIATYLQETWSDDVPDNCEFEYRYSGYLFLLQEIRNHKTRTDVVLVSSSAHWPNVPE